MKDRLRLLHATFAILFIASQSWVFAQDERPSPVFSIVAAGGLSWSGSSSIPFYPYFLGTYFAQVHPGPSFSAGMQYGPLYSIAGTELFVSAELGFGQEAGRAQFGSEYNEARVQRFPTLLWLKAKSTTALSPFLRAGIGAARTDLRETASLTTGIETPISIHRWTFIWGVGGGLNYQFSSKIQLELFVDGWISDARIVRFDQWGNQLGITNSYVLSPFGVRGLYSF